MRINGLFFPIYYYRSELIDGRKRLEAAKATSQKWREVRFDDEREAARYLFVVHPTRALLRFGKGLTMTQQAELFATRPVRIIEARRDLAPPPERPDETPEHRKQLHIRLDGKSALVLARLKASTRSKYAKIIGAALRVADFGQLEQLLMEERKKKRPRRYPRPLKRGDV